jgi:3-hydroxybutyryl-CoA dehydrogenase
MMRFDPGKPIAIIGAGAMGTRVAWASARAGISTRLFDALPGKAATACDEALGFGTVQPELLQACEDLEAALHGVQLAFENVPERLNLKQEVLSQLGGLLDDAAFIGSNTSSLSCAPLALSSGRPDRFFNMNFSDPRSNRLTELMGCDETSIATLRFATQWAEAMGLVALHVAKDQSGYAHNRLWRVIKKEVLRQIAEEVASPEDIDRAWMLGFGDDIGPCGMMDEVGLGTVLAIEEIYAGLSKDRSDEPPEFLRRMVEAGHIGKKSGRGFYTYPDPAFARDDFIQSTLRED